MKTIQINTCTQEELEWLPGVGPATAKKIIEARPIEAKTELEQIVPPSAWLKIQEAEVEFAFEDGTLKDADGEVGILELAEAELSEEEIAILKERWEEAWAASAPPPGQSIPILFEPPIILQEPEPLTLRRVLPGQELKSGAEYLCIWNMRWAPDGQAVMPADAPTQLEIEGWFNEHNMSVAFAHYGASVRLYTRNRGLVPLVLFEIIKEIEDAEEDKGDRQGNGQGD